jgi:hypothetical protein
MRKTEEKAVAVNNGRHRFTTSFLEQCVAAAATPLPPHAARHFLTDALTAAATMARGVEGGAQALPAANGEGLVVGTPSGSMAAAAGNASSLRSGGSVSVSGRGGVQGGAPVRVGISALPLFNMEVSYVGVRACVGACGCPCARVAKRAPFKLDVSLG